MQESIKNQLKIIEDSIRNIHEDSIKALNDAVLILDKHQKKIIFTGIGKAGLVAKKSAATFSSLGIPSTFLHPSEALHGDIGIIENQDLIIIYSNSGESEEIINLLPTLKKRNTIIISLTSNINSTIAKNSSLIVPLGKPQEICYLGLAPTTSTTMMLIFGDILATELSSQRNFSQSAYAENHPSGVIGKKLLQVKQVMRKEFPKLLPETPLKEALMNITKYRTGSACIIDNQKLIGIFTDGDLRRQLHQVSDLNTPIKNMMTVNPKTLLDTDQVLSAIQKFTQTKCDEFPVVNDQNQVVGLLDIQDIILLGIDIDR